MTDAGGLIMNGEAVFGMELGSTRIKAALIAPDNRTPASGGHGWENSRVNGIGIYALDDLWSGIAAAFADLRPDVEKNTAFS